jgi:hypothetical protein
MKAATTLTIDSSPSDSSATDPVTHHATIFRPMTPSDIGMPQNASRRTVRLPCSSYRSSASLGQVSSPMQCGCERIAETMPFKRKTARAKIAQAANEGHMGNKARFVKGSSRHGCRLSRFDSCSLALGVTSARDRTGTGLIGNQRLRPAQKRRLPCAVRHRRPFPCARTIHRHCRAGSFRRRGAKAFMSRGRTSPWASSAEAQASACCR